jgi:streptogramin lyase
VGALILAAAIAGIVYATTRGSSDPTVTVAPNSVAVVDPESRKVVGDIPLGGRPVGIAVTDDGVWVTDADDGTVTRIDPDTYAIVKTIGLGGDVNGIAAGFGSIWVAGGNDETLYRIDPATDAIEEELRLGDADPLRPRPIFFVTAGQKAVWVTRGNSLLRIDPKTTQVTKTVPLPGVPNDLGSGAGSVWVPLTDERLVRVDESSGELSNTSQLPSVAGSPIVTGGSLWLIVYTDIPQVSKFDPNNVTLSASVPYSRGFGGNFPTAIAGSGDVVWAVDHATGRLRRIDAVAARATGSVEIGHHPVSVGVGQDAVWIGTQEEPLRY